MTGDLTKLRALALVDPCARVVLSDALLEMGQSLQVAPCAEAFEAQGATGYGYGYSDGSGYGSGDGYGYSDGSGSGDSDGSGYGDGYGYSDGSGSGSGDGSGYLKAEAVPPSDRLVWNERGEVIGDLDHPDELIGRMRKKAGR